ncbi:MAG TPA: hypothetical protein PKA88_06380 [Polyangiaceae bacterium]|nr:hypothetical protein [Polyangiaceae bacterium]
MTAQGVASLSKPSKQAAMGRRLDALLEQSRGPYSVAGKSVGVTPAFRSLHPNSAQHSPQTYLHKIKSEVGPSVWKEIAMSAAHATGSRGSLKDIQRVTQALIDSPLGKKRLEGFAKQPPELAIRRLMKEHGIGLDCKGYALHGFLEARAENGVRPPNAKYGFGSTDVQPHVSNKLKELGIDSARTGDLIRLSPDGGRDHNVIVRSKKDLVVAPGASLVALGKSPSAEFLKNPAGGPTKITMLTVDGAWGDGNSNDGAVGGVERRVWLRNESTGMWACLDRFGDFQISKGPADHESAVVYRPKAEP